MAIYNAGIFSGTPTSIVLSGGVQGLGANGQITTWQNGLLTGYPGALISNNACITSNGIISTGYSLFNNLSLNMSTIPNVSGARFNVMAMDPSGGLVFVNGAYMVATPSSSTHSIKFYVGNGAAAASLRLDGSPIFDRSVYFMSNNSLRFFIACTGNPSETGNDEGSDIIFRFMKDNGSSTLDTPISIKRAAYNPVRIRRIAEFNSTSYVIAGISGCRYDFTGPGTQAHHIRMHLDTDANASNAVAPIGISLSGQGFNKYFGFNTNYDYGTGIFTKTSEPQNCIIAGNEIRFIKFSNNPLTNYNTVEQINFGKIDTNGNLVITNNISAGGNVSGNILHNINTINTHTTLNNNYYTVLVDANSAPVTITLPPVATSTKLSYVIKKIDSSANSAKISGNLAELIDTTNTISITSSMDKRQIHCDGSKWYIIG